MKVIAKAIGLVIPRQNPPSPCLWPVVLPHSTLEFTGPGNVMERTILHSFNRFPLSNLMLRHVRRVQSRCHSGLPLEINTPFLLSISDYPAVRSLISPDKEKTNES
ncbi:hypothetical protein PM082_015552 [Marasmius tenuissimus]|nr:hypothetical protein PM082_015552 [Marasmius tenuissimus]